MNAPALEPASTRRNFLKEAAIILLGALITVVPFFAGLLVLFDPLKRKGSGGVEVRVATLSSLPDDDLPRKFSVIAAKTDAWNQMPESPIGAVYLRRKGQSVRAWNVVCPHAGCFVDYRSEKKCFLCPCHNSEFGLDGKVTDKASPSPRGMDELTVEVKNQSEIWVHFQNFRSGTHAKIPEA